METRASRSSAVLTWALAAPVPATVFILMLGSADPARAERIDAASCNAADVQAALDRAAPGDTVAVPPGSCSWTTGVAWDAPVDVAFLGAGSLDVPGGGDATVIVDDSPSGAPLLSISGAGPLRLAGFTFRGGAGALKESAVVTVSGSREIRIDHVHFDMSSYEGEGGNSKMIRFIGDVAGVVHDSVFEMQQVGNYLFFQGGDDAPWAEDTGFGGPRFVFVEDNQFTGVESPGGRYFSSVTDCNAGGRFVIRYNAIRSAGVGQTHPTGGAGRGRGCRAHELYGNRVAAAPTYDPDADEPPFTFAYMTSGTLMIWGNDFGMSLYKGFLYLNSLRKDDSTYSQSPTPEGFGYCGTEFTGTGSAWDGNDDVTTGYPCLDHPGRGRGDLLSGDFPNAINMRTGTIAWPEQALEPVYEWANTGAVHPGWGGDRLSNRASSRLQADRDFYLQTASFDGTAGIGAGPRASRPATCTQGVAYWSIDEGGDWNTANATVQDGTLDVCTAPNTWTSAHYTPFTYPHPLRGGPLAPRPDGGTARTDAGSRADGAAPGDGGSSTGSDPGGCDCRAVDGDGAIAFALFLFALLRRRRRTT